MAALVPTIKDKKFVNWLKSALALFFAKQGLDDFVRDEITQFQKDLLASVFQKRALPVGTVCTSCTTENVLHCPTFNFCSKGRICHIHDPTTPSKRPKQPCPNSLCQDIQVGILHEHRYNGPSWKNTDARRWSNDAFEIAKCYMPPDGYAGVTRLADIDLNGSLAVIINNKRFQNKMVAHFKQPNSVCIQAREVGREVRHSADLAVSDSDLVEYIDTLIDLLSDPKFLIHDQGAQVAVDKLMQLKANTLTITTTDVTAVLDKAIKDRQLDALQAIKMETEEAQKEIEEKTEASIQVLKDVKDSIANLQTVTTSCLDQIVAEKQTSLDEVKREAEIQKQEITKAGEKEREKLEKDICRQQSQTKVMERDELETYLKEDLITVYRKYHSKIPVSPLVEEYDVPMTDFYVQPPLTSIDVDRRFGQKRTELSRRAPILSYRDLFVRSDSEMYKDIYVTAKAGVGKTSFAKSVCMTWCQAHRPNKAFEKRFRADDVVIMKQFSFLFFVSLRDIDTTICDLDSMIERSLLSSLARCSRYTRDLLEDILNDRTSLVILDGLDEWSHPTSCARGFGVQEMLHIPARDRCTVLTTTRPWKLAVVKLHSSQIDRHIEINELDESSSQELTNNAVTVLNRQSVPDESKTVEDFEKETSTLKLDYVRYIPYILLQMICLWFDGKSIGRSRREIYTNIMALTLSRGLLKLEKKGLAPRSRQQNSASTLELPTWLQSNDIFRSHWDVLLGLAKLAFEKLFSLKKETALVFDESDVLSSISEEILRFCLEIGLLSQNKYYGSVSERRSTLSFQHKSIQEYFAALHIQFFSDDPETRDRIRKVCNTVPDILDMSNIFIFLAGLCSVAYRKIFQEFTNIFSTDKNVQFYRNSDITGRYYAPRLRECWNTMKSLQCMLTDSMQEIINSGQGHADIYIEDIIIDNTVTLETCGILKHLTKNKENIKSLSMVGFTSTQEFAEKLETLDLQDTCSLHKMIIDAVPKEEYLNRLLSMSVGKLTCLILSFSEFKDNLVHPAITEVSSETMSILSSMNNLQIITLESIRMKHDDVKRLFQYLMTRQTLTFIRLWNIFCVDHGDQCSGYCLDLSQRKTITVLQLNDIPVSMLNVDLSSLERCGIGQLQTVVQASFIQCLPMATNLCLLDFCKFKSEQMEVIIDTLSKLPKLETISIQSTNLGETALTLPPQMIRMELVHLTRVTLTCMSLRRLLDSVDVLPQQVTINLKGCTVIPEEDWRQVKEEIKSSPKYQVLFDGLMGGGLYLFSFQTCFSA
ncbi:uncharacterized protein LOC123526254 [Mercenaria mercenaria]|uniref:uncharacterized protein LOC123526254 n=1 Tax=Mercenaria mercenaria TaxID=6596 RepID=UPI00234F7B5A|nr:uncharacterized protein LOC123526254 [Mercenaria mercenaria]